MNRDEMADAYLESQFEKYPYYPEGVSELELAIDVRANPSSGQQSALYQFQ
jgi:hypothetical protein